MAEKRNTSETLVAVEHRPEAAEVMAFLAELEPQEKKDFLAFVQGIRFARGMTQKSA